MDVFEFIDKHNGFFMVLITLVYVIATIAIWKANSKSAKASEEQINEMRRQFEENNRPRIEVEIRFERRTFYQLHFVNNGQLTAEKVHIEFSQGFIDSLPENSLPEKQIKDILNKQREKECIIGVDQYYDIVIGGPNLRNDTSLKPIEGKIVYQSNNHNYSRDFYIDLSDYVSFLSSDTDEDRIIKAINENTKALNSMQSTIEKITKKDKDNA